MSERPFKCLMCEGDLGEPGMLNAKWFTRLCFTPTDARRSERWFYGGPKVRAVVCRDCGFVHAFTDPKEIDDITAEGHTRCRKCRHILRGLSAPRCPECGEPI